MKIVKLQDGNNGVFPVGKSNPNLLDNPFFTINQQGQSSYGSSASHMISVDRWLKRTTSSVDIVEGGIDFYNNSPTAQEQTWIMQRFPKSGFPSGRVNLSAYVNNTLLSWNATFNGANKSSPTYLNGLFKFQVEYYTNFNNIVLWILESTTEHFIINSVKFELGNKSTLAYDTAPKEADELLKVQRYYQLYATSSLRPSNKDDCVPTMYRNPSQGTISIGGTTYYYNDANIQ